MSRFVQLHVLTSYPPSNLNRDDLGRPKSAIVGGVSRLRISSQSLKRAWRTSEIFRQALAGHIGVRTKEMGVRVFEKLRAQGVGEDKAREWARSIAGCFGKLKADKKPNDNDDLLVEQLVHFGPEEQLAIDELVEKLAARRKAPSQEELWLLRKSQAAADIALFGRMLASQPDFNVEAAAQVAHAFTVHRAGVESDYYTAVDDLKPREEDVGAGHIGETGFGAGVYYLYLCINRELLQENLGGDRALRDRALGALLNAVTKVSPTGKQNSFASRAYASYVLAEKGNQQPRSLALAFVKPVGGPDYVNDAIAALRSRYANMDRVYGLCAAERQEANAETGEGRLDQLIAFVQED
jgi:CRISPR system Cascade subunit CasC